MLTHNYNRIITILLVFVRLFEQISKDFKEGVNGPVFFYCIIKCQQAHALALACAQDASISLNMRATDFGPRFTQSEGVYIGRANGGTSGLEPPTSAL